MTLQGLHAPSSAHTQADSAPSSRLCPFYRDLSSTILFPRFCPSPRILPEPSPLFLTRVFSVHHSARISPAVPGIQQSVVLRSRNFHRNSIPFVPVFYLGNVLRLENPACSIVVLKTNGFLIHHVLFHRRKSNFINGKLRQIPVAQIPVFFIRIMKTYNIHPALPTFCTAKSSSKSCSPKYAFSRKSRGILCSTSRLGML